MQNQLQTVESYIGTFFSKEYILKKVLRMNDAEIDLMQDQIRREREQDIEDGGVSIPDGGDGITRYPQDATGSIIPADDVAKLKGEVPPEGGEEEPKDEPEDDLEDDKSFLTKNGLKGKQK